MHEAYTAYEPIRSDSSFVAARWALFDTHGPYVIVMFSAWYGGGDRVGQGKHCSICEARVVVWCSRSLVGNAQDDFHCESAFGCYVRK